MTLAYFDLANGISGDMAIAALVHAGRKVGVDVEAAITAAVESLDLGCTIGFVDDERGGFACVRAEVKTDDSRHSPRALRDAIERAAAERAPQARALAGLQTLVDAEAVVHGVDPEQVHLHELASADTAADLIGASVGLHALGVRDVTAAAAPVPSGWIRSEHGPLPLPAPVTLEILRGARLHGVDGEKELVTPTGAAILVAHSATFGPLPQMVLRATGVGGGRRISDVPNICRVLVGERVTSEAETQTCVLLETNIDDQTPEALGHAIEILLREGALDAWVTHIVMKRSRPAFLLSALVGPDDEAKITEAIFRHTTTLGVRRRETTRAILERGSVTVNVRGHDIRVKIGRLAGEVVNVAPEFADCVDVADRVGVPTKILLAEATELARRSLNG